jgi:hypothetical protein
VERFVALPPSTLETAESSSNSGLEAGHADRHHHRRQRSRAASTPADLETAARMLAKAECLNKARQEKDMTKKLKIAFQGEPGANSHIAMSEAYPDAEPCPAPPSRTRWARSRPARRPRHDPDREFGRRPRRRHPSSAAASASTSSASSSADPPSIDGRLKAHKSADIKTVESHVHALGQCRASSASSASSRSSRATPPAARRDVSERKDKSVAAIASRLAAQIYGLDILAEGRRGRGPQHHRFVVLAREANWAKQGSGPVVTLLFFGCAICPPRSTRRSAVSPPTAST